MTDTPQKPTDPLEELSRRLSDVLVGYDLQTAAMALGRVTAGVWGQFPKEKRDIGLPNWIGMLLTSVNETAARREEGDSVLKVKKPKLWLPN